MQSKFKSLSLEKFCGGPNGLIISSCTKLIVTLTLNSEPDLAHETGHFELRSTSMRKYIWPLLVFCSFSL